jgi:hypothetical protein
MPAVPYSSGLVPGTGIRGVPVSSEPGCHIESEDEGATTSKRKGRRRNQKRKGKAVLAVEGPGNAGSAKKAKAENPGKEVAECTSCQALVATDKPEGSDK